MIEPHGGSLVNRVLDHKEASELEARAGAMRRIVLGPRESSDLRMVSIGAFSPLTGFLKSDDYASVVADSRLTTGEVWTIPITLAIDAGVAAGIGHGDELALYDMDRNLLGAMKAEDIFTYDPRLEAREVFRTEDENHPGVANLYSQGDVLVGGPIWALPRRPLEVYADADRPPAESRALFESNGWRTIVGFQTRNPIHRAHEYIMKCALELVDGLVVHPLTGETKAGDTDARGQDALLPGTAFALLPGGAHRSVNIPRLHALRRSPRGGLPRPVQEELRVYSLHCGTRPRRSRRLLRHLRRPAHLQRVRRLGPGNSADVFRALIPLPALREHGHF